MISWVSSGKLVMPHWIDRLKRKNCTKIPDRERSQIWVVRLWPQRDNFQLGCFCSLWFNSYKSFHAIFTFNADTSDNVLSLVLILEFLMFLKSSASNLAHLVILLSKWRTPLCAQYVTRIILLGVYTGLLFLLLTGGSRCCKRAGFLFDALSCAVDRVADFFFEDFRSRAGFLLVVVGASSLAGLSTIDSISSLWNSLRWKKWAALIKNSLRWKKFATL